MVKLPTPKMKPIIKPGEEDKPVMTLQETPIPRDPKERREFIFNILDQCTNRNLTNQKVAEINGIGLTTLLRYKKIHAKEWKKARAVKGLKERVLVVDKQLTGIPSQILEAQQRLYSENMDVLTEANIARIMAINKIKIMIDKDIIRPAEVTAFLQVLNEVVVEPKSNVEEARNSFVTFVSQQVLLHKNNNNGKQPISIDPEGYSEATPED